MPPADTDIGVSAFSSPAVLTAAYKWIEEEIQALEAAIKAWKQRHNTLSITARLPSEILAAIFSHLPVDQSPSHSLRSKLKWIQVTHVCTHWRNVALEFPELWAHHIPFGSHGWWTEEMLTRSKAAPLTIVTPVLHSNQKSILSALLSISRIQTLHIWEGQHYGAALDKIVEKFVNPAPLLESLLIQGSDHRSRAIILPFDLFSGNAPRLRELEVNACYNVPWMSPVLSNLTSFKVHYGSMNPKFPRGYLGRVMSALRNMSNLEVLNLQLVLPSLRASDIDEASEPAIHLPHLAQIHLEGDVRPCTYLLDRLVYSTTTAITLSCIVQGFNFDDLVKYPSSDTLDLGRIFHKSCPIQHLTTRYDARVIRMSTSNNVAAQGRSSVPQVEVDIRLEMSRIRSLSSRKKVITKLLQLLFKSIPTQNLESLQVIQGCSVEIWPNVFDCLTGVQLKRLDVIGDGSGIGFLQVFSTIPRSQSESGLPLLPSLRELAIERWDFKEWVDDKTCFAWLKTCLEDRKMKHQVAVHALSLIECRHVTPEDVKELQEVVTGDVIWQKSNWEDLPISLISDDGSSEDENGSDEW